MVSLVVLSVGPVNTFELSDTSKTHLIGRDATCDIVLNDALVSRVHAKLRYVGSRWQIEDCGSRNRFKINQQTVDRELLVNGDLIRIGDSVILFADSSQQRKKKGRTLVEKTTTVSRIDMETSFHPRAGTIVESFAEKNKFQSGLLGKLATLLHVATSETQLFKLCISSLRNALNLQKVRIWLRDGKGRLKLASQFPVTRKAIPPSLYAGLAAENRQGIVFGDDNLMVQNQAVGAGVICAILPGTDAVRGVVECIETVEQKFTVQDLEYLIAVCNIAGPALNKLEQIQSLQLVNAEIEGGSGNGSLLGNSEIVQQLQARILQVASTSSTILISGETGTGKELIAEKVHRQSKQNSGPMITVNCATFSDTLLESALFGHEEGAFTGAVRRHIGAFERADKGTIFLDEIGEMSLNCQAKVLRILEHYPFERVGGSEPVNIDVRIVAATHRDLATQVDAGKFREDLMYRLQVIELASPPLRERGDDILLLSRHFLKVYSDKLGKPLPTISKTAQEQLIRYQWPGNVRELKNMMERVMVFNTGEPVDGRDFQMKQSKTQAFPISDLGSIQELESRYIEHVMTSVAGNKTEACKILGISRATLYNKLTAAENEPTKK